MAPWEAVGGGAWSSGWGLPSVVPTRCLDRGSYVNGVNGSESLPGARAVSRASPGDHESSGGTHGSCACHLVTIFMFGDLGERPGRLQRRIGASQMGTAARSPACPGARNRIRPRAASGGSIIVFHCLVCNVMKAIASYLFSGFVIVSGGRVNPVSTTVTPF